MARLGLDNIAAVVGSTTTVGDGTYGFTVMPGDYQVQFDLPEGRVFSPTGQGEDDSADSDVDGAGNSFTATVLSADEIDTIDA